jgi:hypothetical protein
MTADQLKDKINNLLKGQDASFIERELKACLKILRKAKKNYEH